MKEREIKWWAVAKFASNPIEEKSDGWYFWDETWAHAHGPFCTYEEAIFLLGRYCSHLEIENNG